MKKLIIYYMSFSDQDALEKHCVLENNSVTSQSFLDYYKIQNQEFYDWIIHTNLKIDVERNRSSAFPFAYIVSIIFNTLEDEVWYNLRWRK